MSVMFEVYYKPPQNPAKESALTDRVLAMGGRLDYREGPGANGATAICLTYEFDNYGMAQAAADALREQGEHVEGPMEYGRA